MFSRSASPGGLRDDILGLVHFDRRDYIPDVGRWASRDPIGFRGGQANLFAYSLGDPINNRDARGTGRKLFAVCQAAVQGLSVAQTLFGLGGVAEGLKGLDQQMEGAQEPQPTFSPQYGLPTDGATPGSSDGFCPATPTPYDPEADLKAFQRAKDLEGEKFRSGKVNGAVKQEGMSGPWETFLSAACAALYLVPEPIL